MTESKDLIIISASCGKNLELAEKFLKKSNELKYASEIGHKNIAKNNKRKYGSSYFFLLYIFFPR